jgi:hypothetical protein
MKSGTSFTVYVNGILNGTSTIADNVTSGAGKFSIGQEYDGSGPSDFYLGMMSDFQVWDTLWTAADVTYDYLNPESLALNNSGTALTESNLKLWYPMQDGHRGQQSYILDGANTGAVVELVTNGGFDTDSDWTPSGVATIANGVASIGSATSSSFYSQSIVTNGKTYKVSFTVSNISGGNSARVFNNSGETLLMVNSNGDKSFTFTHSIASQLLLFYANAGTFFDLDNVSVKQINDKHHATTVFYGDELVENESFATSSDWTPQTGWTVSGNGVATVDSSAAGTTNVTSTDMTVVVGRTYYAEMYVDSASGTGLRFDLGGVNGGSYLTTTGLRTATITATSTAGFSMTASGSDTAAQISYVSVKEVGLASGWTDADQQLHIPQTALQSYNELLWCTASEGTNAIVEVADNSNLDVDALDFSISCWIYPITESDYLPIFRKGGAGVEGYSLVVNTSNYIALNLNDGASDNGYTNLTDAVVPSGKWSHVVVTCDRSSSTGVRCYLNGVLQAATANPTGENEDIGNSSGVVLLGWSTSDADSFSGAGTEFMLFKDSILSSSEVLELYNDGKALDGTTHSLFSTKCTAYYRNNGLSSWSNLATVADSGATSTAAAAGAVSAGGTETILIPQGVDSTRDAQGFIMNKQKSTSCLNLDGIAYEETAVDSSLTDITNGTIQFWLKNTNTVRFVVFSEDAGTDYLGAWNPDGTGLWYNGGATGTVTSTADNNITLTTGMITDGDWHMHTMTGVNLSSFTVFQLGNYSDTFPLKTTIDGLKVYSRVLTSTEIIKNYKATKGNHRN